MGKWKNLLDASKKLRAAQRAYMANRADRSYDAAVEREELGRKVAAAAEVLDIAIQRAEQS